METDNLDIINKAFQLILPSLAKFVGSTLKEKDKKNWWKNYVINKLSDVSISNFPKEGSYDECINSLDVLACLNIIIKNWRDIFKNKFKKDNSFFNYAHEIIKTRHDTAHITQETIKKFSDKYTKRALDTMELFMEPIDPKIYEKLNSIKLKIETTRASKHKKTVIKPVKPIDEKTNKETENIEFKDKCIIIKIKQEIIDNRGDLYEAVRCFWDMKKEEAEKADYVLAVVRGEYIVQDVFKPTTWYEANEENIEKYGVKKYYRNEYKDRIFFVGEKADDEIRNRYLDKALPDKCKCRRSFQYSWNL